MIMRTIAYSGLERSPMLGNTYPERPRRQGSVGAGTLADKLKCREVPCVAKGISPLPALSRPDPEEPVVDYGKVDILLAYHYTA
jgi:hypothetical protein